MNRCHFCKGLFFTGEVFFTCDGHHLHARINNGADSCYWKYKRHKKQVQRQQNGTWRWLVAIAFIFTLSVHAEEGDVKGCYVTYNPNNGGFLYEPFIKIAHPKENPSQDGEPEIWGFRPWNLEPPDEQGLTPPVNILESRFVPLGTFSEVNAGTTKRKIKCPDGLW